MSYAPIKAIEMKCIDCSGGSKKEVELCVMTNCPLYNYRNTKSRVGLKPKRTYTEEQKKEMAKRFTKNT